MTAVAVPGSARPTRFRPARMLRLEIRHSPIVWALPVLAGIFYFNTWRTVVTLTPTWTQSVSVVTGPMLIYVCVFAAGLAAWVGTREGRRGTGDLLATTARLPWARQATVFAATAFWTVLAFLAETAVVYLLTARQATWGGPPLWPVAVGVVCTVTATALGLTAGTLVASRFTAPVVAVAVFVLEFVGFKAADNVFDNRMFGASTYALLVPDQGLPHSVEDGVFDRVPPDVAIAQLMFMGGLLLMAAGLLALSPALRAAGARGPSLAAVGRPAAVLAAALVGCGVAASATAFTLAGTAHLSPVTGDWEIATLHDAATDRPVPYTPVCAGGAFPVCIHPAFAGYLDAVSAALQPAAAEIAGLPGAPVRAELAVGDAPPAAAGTTSVYDYSGTGAGSGVGGSWFGGAPAETINTIWSQGYQQSFVYWYVSGPITSVYAQPDPDAAQQAVADALLAKIGAPAPDLAPPTKAGGAPAAESGAAGTSGAVGEQASAAQIAAAASRVGSLPSAARRAWLTAHLAALRSGAVTLAQLP